MHGSASYPAALGSSKWIAAYLAKHRNDDDIWVKTSNKATSKHEAKFLALYKKRKAELRSMFSMNEKNTELAVDGPSNSSGSQAENKDAKSIWSTIFDTKSGNKLHKRTKSAPVVSHIPHLLSPINEDSEGQETPVLNSTEQPTTKTLSRKPSVENLQRLTDHEADDDNVSIITTCTIIIQQASLQAVPEEDGGRAESREATTNDEVATIGEQSPVSNQTTNGDSARSASDNHNIIRSTILDSIPPQEQDGLRIECSGALLPPDMLDQYENNDLVMPQREAKRPKHRKRSSAGSSIKAILDIFLGSDKGDDELIESEESPRKLRHKFRLPSSWSGRKLNSSAQSRSEPSHDYDQLKKNANYRPLSWHPPESNEMGELIRCFSGDLNKFSRDNAKKTRSPKKLPTKVAYPPEFDVSMNSRLPPMPARHPWWGRRDVSIQEVSSVEDSEDSCHSEDLRHSEDSRHSEEIQPDDEQAQDEEPENEEVQDLVDRVHTPTTWRQRPEPGKCFVMETQQQAYRRHESCLKNIDRLRREGLLGPDPSDSESPSQPKPREQVQNEQRLVREMREDFQKPPKDISSSESQNVENHDNGQQSIAQLQFDDGNGQPQDVQDIESPMPIEGLTIEPLDAHILGGFEDEDEDLPEDTPPARPFTEAALKDHHIDLLSEWFSTLQDRSKSPERFIAARDPQAVINWRNGVAELASNKEMFHEEAIEEFYQQASSIANSQTSLSELSEVPNRSEVEVALADTNAPIIQGFEPYEVLARVNYIDHSIQRDLVAKAAYRSQLQPAISRNQVIFDEYERAKFVYARHGQKNSGKEFVGHEDAVRRRNRKIYRALDRHLDEGERRLIKVNREAYDAHKFLSLLQADFDAYKDGIHRITERLGHRRADNLQGAVELIRQTEREENIQYRRTVHPDAPDQESPESCMAGQADQDYAELVANHVDKTIDPTSEFF
ncbi:hypothetical protein F53441_12892 [Fusarium austroafricanum]|uniref:Uncharacterized protein n=1 Tax=Fusarium austroafricanum TaxID=2364996 RepID=A0A8H4NM40_9HYPO|nr:hypothetical protein F53441_12892 [Fusarium austroafricanum]